MAASFFVLEREAAHFRVCRDLVRLRTEELLQFIDLTSWSRRGGGAPRHRRGRRQRERASPPPGSFGLAALALAALGISGALAESISRREAELGVRLALGSSPHRLFGLAIRDGLRPALVGTLAGSALSLAVARLIASQLYGIKPWTQPSTPPLAQPSS